MKKYLLSIFIVIFAFALFACNTTNEKDDEKNNNGNNEKVTHIVKYISEGKEFYKQEVDEGVCTIEPSSPLSSSDEYIFKEWQLNGVKFSFETPITEDITLTAKFVENPKVVQLFVDRSFSNGFGLRGVSTNDGSKVFRHLTADSQEDEYYWDMAQWWTKYDMTYAEYSLENGVHVYKNESHEVRIDNKNSSLYMKLLASKEYDAPRKDGQNWPHILIEQSQKNVKIAGAKKVIASLDFNIIRCDNMMSEAEYSPSRHAAQYLWYLTLRNIVPDGSDPEKVGKNGDFFWFGMPIYDNRSPKGVESYKMIDQGFVGATNKLIYGMSSREYLKDLPIKFGTKYHIEIDILPYLKEAYIYGITNGALENTNWENMYLGYMNFGWELPGTFDVESEVSNISVKVYY